MCSGISTLKVQIKLLLQDVQRCTVHTHIAQSSLISSHRGHLTVQLRTYKCTVYSIYCSIQKKYASCYKIWSIERKRKYISHGPISGFLARWCIVFTFLLPYMTLLRGFLPNLQVQHTHTYIDMNSNIIVSLFSSQNMWKRLKNIT